MPDTTRTVTIEKPLIRPERLTVLVLVLAVLGGIAAGLVGSLVKFPADASAATKLVPFTLAVAGVLLGAGLALLLGDLRVTETRTESTAAAGGEESVGAPDIVIEGLKVLKDLSGGKTLLVLGIVLIVFAMWTANGGS